MTTKTNKTNENKLQELLTNQVASALEVAKAESKKEAKTKKATKKTEDDAKAETKKEKVTREVIKQQNAAIVEQVISHREVKYIYPEDVVETLDRKRWRQATRNELRKLERNMLLIKDTNTKEYTEAKEAFDNFKAQVLKPSQTA